MEFISSSFIAWFIHLVSKNVENSYLRGHVFESHFDLISKRTLAGTLQELLVYVVLLVMFEAAGSVCERVSMIGASLLL